jgi:alpha-L-rhamnosidase
MKKISLLLLSFQCLILSIAAQVKIDHLRTENLNNPICIDVLQPNFSWQLISDQRNVMQSAYEIRVGTTAAAVAKGGIWNSRQVITDRSVHVPYKGAALISGKKYYWQVRIWDNYGKASAWSTINTWQMGLLQLSDWKAQWIEPGYKEDSVFASPLLRKEFNQPQHLLLHMVYTKHRSMASE